MRNDRSTTAPIRGKDNFRNIQQGRKAAPPQRNRQVQGQAPNTGRSRRYHKPTNQVNRTSTAPTRTVNAQTKPIQQRTPAQQPTRRKTVTAVDPHANAGGGQIMRILGEKTVLLFICLSGILENIVISNYINCLMSAITKSFKRAGFKITIGLEDLKSYLVANKDEFEFVSGWTGSVMYNIKKHYLTRVHMVEDRIEALRKKAFNDLVSLSHGVCKSFIRTELQKATSLITPTDEAGLIRQVFKTMKYNLRNELADFFWNNLWEIRVVLLSRRYMPGIKDPAADLTYATLDTPPVEAIIPPGTSLCSCTANDAVRAACQHVLKATPPASDPTSTTVDTQIPVGATPYSGI